jgi:hypothetical protein
MLWGYSFGILSLVLKKYGQRPLLSYLDKARFTVRFLVLFGFLSLSSFLVNGFWSFLGVLLRLKIFLIKLGELET